MSGSQLLPSNVPNRRYIQAFYIAPLVIWMLLIFFASTKAGGNDNSASLIVRLLGIIAPEESHRMTGETLRIMNYVVRKMAHITEYAILTLLAVRAIQFGAVNLKPSAFLGAFGISVLYAMSDEIHQRFVPGRTSTSLDVLIDMCGVALVLVGILVLFGIKSMERFLWKSVSSNNDFIISS